MKTLKDDKHIYWDSEFEVGQNLSKISPASIKRGFKKILSIVEDAHCSPLIDIEKIRYDLANKHEVNVYRSSAIMRLFLSKETIAMIHNLILFDHTQIDIPELKKFEFIPKDPITLRDFYNSPTDIIFCLEVICAFIMKEVRIPELDDIENLVEFKTNFQFPANNKIDQDLLVQYKLLMIEYTFSKYLWKVMGQYYHQIDKLNLNDLPETCAIDNHSDLIEEKIKWIRRNIGEFRLVGIDTKLNFKYPFSSKTIKREFQKRLIELLSNGRSWNLLKYQQGSRTFSTPQVWFVVFLCIKIGICETYEQYCIRIGSPLSIKEKELSDYYELSIKKSVESLF